MTGPASTTAKRVRRARRVARLSLLMEAVIAAAWPATVWTAGFLALWMLGIPALLGLPANIVAICFFLCLAGLVFLAPRRFQHPDADAVDRLLERRSGLWHRPLAHLADRPAGIHDEKAAALWRRSLESAASGITRLRLPVPRPILAGSDRYAFRFLALLLFIAGLAVAGPDAGQRLREGLLPWHRPAASALAPRHDVVVQITPPAYTGLPVIVATGGRSAKAFLVPAGSTIKARVHGGWFRPVLSFGETRVALRQSGDDWQAETVAAAGKSLVIRQGLLRLADLAYTFKPARPPVIQLSGAPETLDKGQWRLTASVQDDYGIAGLILHMRLDPAIKNAPPGRPVDEDRTMMIFSGKPQTIRPVFDLSWHEWAGLPVILTLEARNHEGLSATSAPVKATIPLRAFHHPVAQAIAANRRDLIWTPEKSAIIAAYKLEQLLNDPGSFGGNISVFLALRSASSRLYYMPRLAASREVLPLLWQAAVTVEDGALPFTAKDLRQAQDRLRDLLADPNATAEQIAQAMNEMRDALGKYLTEIMRRIQGTMIASGMQPLSQEEMNQIVRPDDIAAFLDAMQARANKGDRMAAQKMLAQLSQMTDEANPETASAPPRDMQFMAEAMKRTQAMIATQQALMRRTQDGTLPVAAIASAQDKLRGDLEDLMARAVKALGQPPQSLQDADKAMRASSAALAANARAASLTQQVQAIEALQQGGDDMKNQMRARLKQMMMALSGRQRDPMGHDTGEDNGNGLSSGTVRIPDQGKRRQVQDILRTLRQRSGELTRPEYEREYYQRLMEQY